jgi:arylsulfatase A-like enzyme
MAGLFALGCGVTPLIAAIKQRSPNIIFILADDLGYGDLGCYGQEKIQTPALDRLAAEGVRFTQFYSGSTVCAPARSVLMTGQHVGHTRVRGNAGLKNPEAQMLRTADITVAEVLKSAGYATGLVGKWGLGLPGDEGAPNKQGFDYFFGFLSQVHAHNHFPDYLWRNDQKVLLPNEIVPVGESGAGYATNRQVYAGDLFAQEARDFITRNQARPFFLYYAVTVPHANNERTKALGLGQEVPDYGIYQARDWTEAHKGQAAMITRLDNDIARLLALIKQLGLEEQTAVFFSSDNGPHKEGGNDPNFFKASGPFRGIKRDLTDGGIRVPFLVRWPGKIAPGQVSGHVGYFGDFMATVAEMAQVKPPKNIDSISLLPTLLSRAWDQPQHAYLYWEFHERGSSQAVLLNGQWKGIRLNRRDAPIQLYDLRSDPAEQNNVATQNLQIVAQVEKLFRTARTASVHWPLKDFVPPAKSGGKEKE